MEGRIADTRSKLNEGSKDLEQIQRRSEALKDNNQVMLEMRNSEMEARNATRAHGRSHQSESQAQTPPSDTIREEGAMDEKTRDYYRHYVDEDENYYKEEVSASASAGAGGGGAGLGADDDDDDNHTLDDDDDEAVDDPNWAPGALLKFQIRNKDTGEVIDARTGKPWID